MTDIRNQKLFWIRADNGKTGEVPVGEIIDCVNRDISFHEGYFLYASIEERATHVELLKSLAQEKGND